MRVVVTRPEASGLKTAELLRERGHDPVMLPLTRPIHDSKAVASAFSKRFDTLAITSAEAIRAIVACGVDMDTIRHTTLFAVGQASANAARSAGFENVVAGKGDGHELAQTISDIGIERQAGTVLYLAGSVREVGFEERLCALHIPFETVEVYGMEPVNWDRAGLEAIVSSRPIDAVLFYSSEAVRGFFDLMHRTGVQIVSAHIKFICISDKVLSLIPEPLQAKAFAARTPRETEMFDLLDRMTGT
ncbi:uroporphyrinogen-III synthase [Agrobacterium vaccinii]|uniref:uroporphyrinogen-III synthase n=1 Tax=Agrobacterium vaccinii TaxID=2735528 RepID=UPI001E51FE3B|nr:uroporphyrinogen-III synthase [Agrobacterium vaccinii]UHS57710.1 uroporphyrinogen-III synthase [Agrobacterium vaccinii]